MIQRVQNLYLLIVGVLMTFAAVKPLAHVTVEGGLSELFAYNLIYLEILVVISAVLPFVMIGMCKNLLAQLRLCFAELVMLVGTQAFFVVYLMKISNGLADQYAETEVFFNMATPVIFPAVGIVLILLAIRAITKDFRKINALNRIR